MARRIRRIAAADKKRRPIKAKEPHVRRLFQHMDARDIPIRVAAELSGVEERNISNWRAGTATPRLDLFVAVCKAVKFAMQLEFEL